MLYYIYSKGGDKMLNTLFWQLIEETEIRVAQCKFNQVAFIETLVFKRGTDIIQFDFINVEHLMLLPELKEYLKKGYISITACTIYSIEM